MPGYQFSGKDRNGPPPQAQIDRVVKAQETKATKGKGFIGRLFGGKKGK